MREEASSEGKRMGEMGQLRKEREWREERDLRAVKERATSSAEQLERERERRWRKGLEESQRRVALFLLWHGSLEVGMLRDCRALSCFGSSVEGEEDEEGVVGVGLVGVGEEVGEGVGDREIDLEAVVVTERMNSKRVKKNRGGRGGGAIVDRDRGRDAQSKDTVE
ncbi:hypothetical protein F2P56_006444 [Juglans regia]|uniref:Uncharacterized protein n=1 Tax=Juglans regia TaxID=51240 RepID=A0A833XZI5_JUGRE|nr:hypothetical protein F2P56_006444 [Juglans regia]